MLQGCHQSHLDGDLGDAAQVAGDVVERTLADDVVGPDAEGLPLAESAEGTEGGSEGGGGAAGTVRVAEVPGIGDGEGGIGSHAGILPARGASNAWTIKLRARTTLPRSAMPGVRRGMDG